MSSRSCDASESVEFEFVPTCSNNVCHEDAVAIIRHPQHGRRVVCETHQDSFEVIDDV